MRRILVTAIADGWKVSLDGVSNDMVFRSGREAERAARRLADRLARAGVDSEIQLHLKDGSLAAKFLSPAPARRSANDNAEALASGRPAIRRHAPA